MLARILQFCVWFGFCLFGLPDYSSAQIVLSGSVPLTANATDNVGVAQVQFLLDGDPIGVPDTDPPYTFGWNTLWVQDGDYTLAARAWDLSGNSAVSAGVLVRVENLPDSEASGSGADAGYSDPDGGLAQPAVSPSDSTASPGGVTAGLVVSVRGAGDGPTLSGSVIVAAEAGGEIIDGVEFLLDEVVLHSDSVAPYEVVWDTTGADDGVHFLRARLYDGTTSESVEVIVSNSMGGSGGTGDGFAVQPPAERESSFDEGTISTRIEQSGPASRRIRARSDAGDRLELYIDNQLTMTADGRTLDYDWDVESVLGAREVRVVALDRTAIVATSSVFYEPDSASAPFFSLEVAEVAIVGVTLVKATVGIDSSERLELYIDRQLKATSTGSAVEYAWSSKADTDHEILLVAYDSVGIVASISVAR